MQRFWRRLATLAVASLIGGVSASMSGPLLWSVSAAPGPSASQPGKPDSTVTLQLFQFNPMSLEVKAGTQVTWANQDDILHTVTSGSPENRDHRFEVPLDGKGASSTFTFTQVGTYPYFCDRHQSMRGEIRVR
jgi:plastocyanin